jgi:hypothetical protein
MAEQNKHWPKFLILGTGGAIAFAAAVFVYFSNTTQMPSNDPAPLVHPKITNSATLTGARAELIYQAVRGQLRKSYLRADNPITEAYQSWRRYNRTPYRSPNHGERFVNHYANAEAAGYGEFENLSPLPEGAIIIKDSFSLTRSGDLRSGPFFMMEKMPAGFPSLAGTWRFMMLRGDGTMVGITDGSGSDKVRFCAECHYKSGPKHDYLFFMPQDARIHR